MDYLLSGIFCFMLFFAKAFFLSLAEPEDLLSPKGNKTAAKMRLRGGVELLTRFELVTSSLPRTCSAY